MTLNFVSDADAYLPKQFCKQTSFCKFDQGSLQLGQLVQLSHDLDVKIPEKSFPMTLFWDN